MKTRRPEFKRARWYKRRNRRRNPFRRFLKRVYGQVYADVLAATKTMTDEFMWGFSSDVGAVTTQATAQVVVPVNYADSPSGRPT